MDEIKRLTPAQRARCNRLIRRLCANYAVATACRWTMAKAACACR